jgi:hypothetical protein
MSGDDTESQISTRRRRQPSRREVYLTIGKLAPVFEDDHETAGRMFVENLARFKPGHV